MPAMSSTMYPAKNIIELLPVGRYHDLISFYFRRTFYSRFKDTLFFLMRGTPYITADLSCLLKQIVMFTLNNMSIIYTTFYPSSYTYIHNIYITRIHTKLLQCRHHIFILCI